MAGLKDQLTAQSLDGPSQFNWPWFVEFCVCGIIALFFLFYFNRLFATLISYGIRAYAWHHYRIWIDIQALQISLLGGRIFFKGVRYHGENETIFVHNGYITWRYWFHHVRHADLLATDAIKTNRSEDTNPTNGSEISSKASADVDEEQGTARKRDSTEARVAIYVTGLEWFIYNRTPLYDAILRDDGDNDQAPEQESNSPGTGFTSSEALKVHLRSKFRRRPKSSDTSSSNDTKLRAMDSEKFAYSVEDDDRRSTTTEELTSAEIYVTAFQSLLVQLLPLYVECSRTAISIGNEHTRAILITTVEKARGHIDARGCGPNDIFQQVFDFDIEHPIVHMKPNPDFVGTQLSVAERIITESDKSTIKRRWWRWNLDLQRRKHNAVHAIRSLVPGLQSSVESLHHSDEHQNNRTSYKRFAEPDQDDDEWHGLSRYLDENDADDHQAWAHIDYARFSTVLDCPSAHMTFYWDLPGRVRAKHISFNTAPTTIDDDINGVKAPAYGMDFTIRGGDINYGPWADRLRAEIQSVFFPASYRSATPAKPLKVGDWRQSTNMIIRVDIEEEVTMRIPMRESSKDWRWRGRATAVRDAAAIRKQRQKRHFRLRRGPKSLMGPDIRPFGWISVSVSPDSSVRYEMDMVPGKHGYKNHLQLDIKGTKATSSVNHADLWRCDSHKIQCDLSTPLVWNSQHTWQFNVQSQSMDLFILRDHMFLLTDLVTDFTAGQKSNYMTFVPFEYKLGLRFNDMKLYLNLNDYNIIDNPCDLESNAFLILVIPELEANIDIPMRYFSAPQSSVHFQAFANNGYMNMKTPTWNTLHYFQKEELMGTLKRLDLSGSYNYNAGTSSSLTDSLFMDIFGGTPKVYLQGFLIRYFMNLKENYFGEDLHFRTLEEYQSRLGPDNQMMAEDQRTTAKKENDLDVILTIRAEDSCALMPANIYQREENLRIDIMLVEADLRVTNYYMDLQVNTSPIEVSVEKEVTQKGQAMKDRTACQVYIDSVSVYGHRLFGAPPAEPTYICNWDFDVGSIYGESSTALLQVLIAAVQAFVFTFDDKENALPITRTTVIDDVTFLRARVNGIQLWIVTDVAAFLLGTGPLAISFNDLAGQHFSQNLRADIPSITIAAIDVGAPSRRQGKSKQTVPALACVQTSVNIANIDKKANFEHQRQLQQNHVKFHDMRTYRANCLLRDPKPLNIPAAETQWSEDPPAMPVPELPNPVLHSTERVNGTISAPSTRYKQRQRSFLSASSMSHLEEQSLPGDQSPRRAPSRRQRGSKIDSGSGEEREKLEDIHAISGVRHTKDAPFSSPWIEPHFSLLKLELDLSQMPSLRSSSERDVHSTFKDSGAEEDFTDSDESLPHGAIFCSLPAGLRGFSSPLLFPAIIDLLQRIAPQDPHSLLDAIQQSTMANISGMNVESQGGKVDFAVKIPGAAFRLVDKATDLKQIPNLSADHYELVVSQVRLHGRVAPTIAKNAHGQTKKNILLLQASIHEIDICVSENLESSVRDVAKVHLSIKDVAFWLSMQDEVRTKLQVGLLRVATGGSTVDRMSMLAERSRVMITNIVEGFNQFDQAYSARHLVYHLILLRTQTTEPAFLSKPSYVLRSAAEHVRIADSWKIIARFRQRLLSLSLQERTDLVTHTSCLFEHQQDRAQQQILESIDNWMTWDRNHEACGPILEAIFGKSASVIEQPPEVAIIEVGVYLGQISIVIDPGPQQSELLLQSCDFNLSQKPVLEDDVEPHGKKYPVTSALRAQVWFADVVLDINWHLIELAKSLVKQMNLSAAIAEMSTRQPTSLPKPPVSQLDLVVVAGTDSASAKISTVNLNVLMSAKSLKVSTVVQSLETSSTASLLVTSSSAHLRLASRYRRLLNWRLQSPSVYGSYQQNQRSLDGSDPARLAASCDRLRFDMKEDALSVLEVVDTVIRDEVATIQEIVNSIEQQTIAVKPDAKSTTLKLDDVHVAFFLNNYKLQFCVLPSLRYSIVGTDARTSLVPQNRSAYVIHIDIKENRHVLVEPKKGYRSSPAALEIPPISGKVVIVFKKDRIVIDARSTLERVKIETSAVYACVEAAYQPQNVARLKDGKTIIERIQRSIKKLEQRPPTAAPPPPSSKTDNDIKKAISYSGHVAFEGFDIHCGAPDAHNQAYRVDLRLGLQETILRIHNRHKMRAEPLLQPQFEVNVRQVFLGLYRQTQRGTRNFGRFGMDLRLKGTTRFGHDGEQTQNYNLLSQSTQLDLYTETAALVIDLIVFLQSRIAEITTVEERKRITPLRRLTLASGDLKIGPGTSQDDTSSSIASSNIFDTTFGLDLNAIQIRWIVTDDPQAGYGRIPEDLVFSIRQIDLRTQRESSARLTILDTQLQTVPKSQKNPVLRTANSALLPEMIFNAAHFSTKKDRRFAFQAAGKTLDLRLAADGILPLSTIQKTMARMTADVRNAKMIQPAQNDAPATSITSFLGNKRLTSLLVDTDFAGAVVRITPCIERDEDTKATAFGQFKGPKRSRAGRYGQAVQIEGAEEAVLRAPGIAFKVEYLDSGLADPTLSTEVKVAASSNTLAPSVVPLMLEIYSSIKEIIGDDNSEDSKSDAKAPTQKYLTDAASTDTDPTAILGRVRLNAGLWVQKQEFSLTCQPIARVAATAMFDEIFVTINTVQDGDHERFFSIITTFNRIQASVQHVYSRESTASFEVESIIMSLMNSKHISAKNGISAILNITPMKASLNAKQMQDFLLFREIWYPAELRQQSKPPTQTPTATESQAYAMQKYHELAATAALPWHAVISMQELKLDIDFGQSLGKSSFIVSKLWASSKKNSDWEQNLCIGFDRIGIDSSGRMSGFIELNGLRVRTSIRWPVTKNSDVRAPLVQASIGFSHLRLKTAFDYQPFAVADISSFEFLMYNVRPNDNDDNDRLVGILKGGKVQVFCISAAAAQALSIVQAFERLFQEKKDAFQDSLQELDRLLRRKSIFPAALSTSELPIVPPRTTTASKRESYHLHTDVVVTIGVIDIGAFPNTFFDSQILKVEAVDVQARFAVASVEQRIQSGLSMTLGQVRVALSTINRTNTKALGEVEIEEVIERATSAGGGIILKVPRLVASMKTWQQLHSSTVEYIFRSTFQGKVDVGWNYSRIRFIRGMWDTHSQALAHRLGKPLPPSAVKITAEPQQEGSQQAGQEKITAVVNVPQSSKFQYVPLEPPIIDTPQLRDMGEATPPLEWIGLHRDKLPNVTHSIVIVSLLEVAKEVEDAYTKILGTG